MTYGSSPAVHGAAGLSPHTDGTEMTLGEHDPCRCPVLLAFQAEEKLCTVGMVRYDYTGTAAISIGLLRQQHGCPGPRRNGECYWSRANPADNVRSRDDVPLLKISPEPEDGQYV